ncbi:UNVERIFIED_CONTAM: Malonyl-coenzyme:anthocyanin 5-O-glucoside-6'''-O-malonyltransferase [Sesamum latifolium]|uniref:Malonyl-coenzyme:anthocyanin 5-O-glucoside-6'''-O-malonyltransferase n=1 Tax=Sesamum latifolium TaxID=2727402 RepID=A0AAW2XXL2_9LAMI
MACQFLPLAGNNIHPLKPGSNPVLRYECGDSVSFTVFESIVDFNHLTGNHPRGCDEFYTFAPHLPPAIYSENSVSCPVLALQVTIFLGQGLCIGFVTHRVVADASTVVSFMQVWALINRSKPNGADNIRELLAEANLLPFYDRKRVPVLVICALAWVCSVKTTTLCGEDVGDDDPEYFGFVADCRGRLNEPLAANYFKNCVAPGNAVLKHGVVKGSDGFVMAAKAIDEAIKETVFSGRGILHGAEKWLDERWKLVERRQYGLIGSLRFDFYAVDYGWGKLKKFEPLFIDGGGCFYLCQSRDFEGCMEIVLSKSRVQMDAFTMISKEILDGLLP